MHSLGDYHCWLRGQQGCAYDLNKYTSFPSNLRIKRCWLSPAPSTTASALAGQMTRDHGHLFGNEKTPENPPPITDEVAIQNLFSSVSRETLPSSDL